jgi:hypothetical protein
VSAERGDGCGEDESGESRAFGIDSGLVSWGGLTCETTSRLNANSGGK